MRAHGVYIQSAMINEIAAWLVQSGSNEPVPAVDF